MNQFKFGDKVKVYGCFNHPNGAEGESFERECVVIGIGEKDKYLIHLKQKNKIFWAHYKQCELVEKVNEPRD